MNPFESNPEIIEFFPDTDCTWEDILAEEENLDEICSIVTEILIEHEGLTIGAEYQSIANSKLHNHLSRLLIAAQKGKLKLELLDKILTTKNK